MTSPVLEHWLARESELRAQHTKAPAPVWPRSTRFAAKQGWS